MRMENRSACAMVNCKLCKYSDSAVLIIIKRNCNQSANKSCLPIYNPLFS
jgi:hypothetical protein